MVNVGDHIILIEDVVLKSTKTAFTIKGNKVFYKWLKLMEIIFSFFPL